MMNSWRRFHEDRCGATIVEFLISGVLSLVVISAGFDFYLSSHHAWESQSQVADVQQNARASLDDIARTLRMAGYGLSNPPAFVIGHDSLTIYLSRNGVSDTVHYYVSTSDTLNPVLMKKVAGSSPATFADGIESLTVTPVSATLLTVAVTARSSKRDTPLIAADGYRRRTVTTEVLIRNAVS